MPRPPQHLFAYGSLLSSIGDPAHETLERRAEFVGHAWITGRLYVTGDYPTAVLSPDPDERVYGELYALVPGQAVELLSDLDRYEHYLPQEPEDSFYLRIAAEATLATGGTVAAWVYVANEPVDELPRIASGDYAAHIRTGLA